MHRLIRFLQESVAELSKVTWPSRETTIQYSVIVVISVAVFTTFFGLIDFGLSELVTTIFIGR